MCEIFLEKSSPQFKRLSQGPTSLKKDYRFSSLQGIPKGESLEQGTDFFMDVFVLWTLFLQSANIRGNRAPGVGTCISGVGSPSRSPQTL